MRIYLDNCIYQDLKKGENKIFYDLILKSKEHHNIYLFSEAHLSDLSRDITEEKYIDMELIESICDNNCLLNDINGATLLTPKEYYDMYNWDYIPREEDTFDNNDTHIRLIMSMLENTPLPFNSIFKSETFSSKFPKEFVDTFTEPSNFKEYIALMLTASGRMNEQPFFKGILQGNREINTTEEFYRLIGINGFDGENITNKEKFRQSYVKYINKSHEFNKKSKVDAYQTFINMYMGLEILNIVKDKAQKQKFTNLMNDSGHAYFGAQCDIVVSKDIDFLKKTKFMYDIFDINTLVLSLEEFKDIPSLYKENSFHELVNEVVNISNYLNNDDNDVLSVILSKTYIGYFNILYRVAHESKWSFIITKKVDEYKNKSLIKEIEFITNKLVDNLGKDVAYRMHFNRDEIVDGHWNGRTWSFGKITICLNFRSVIELTFYKTRIES